MLQHPVGAGRDRHLWDPPIRSSPLGPGRGQPECTCPTPRRVTNSRTRTGCGALPASPRCLWQHRLTTRETTGDWVRRSAARETTSSSLKHRDQGKDTGSRALLTALCSQGSTRPGAAASEHPPGWEAATLREESEPCIAELPRPCWVPTASPAPARTAQLPAGCQDLRGQQEEKPSSGQDRLVWGRKRLYPAHG